MTITDYALEYEGGELDIDVCDTDIDMLVALCYDIGSTEDAYDRFLGMLCDNVEVENINDAWGSDILVCKFTEFFESYRPALANWFKVEGYDDSDFEFDEPEYKLVEMLEGLISGNYSEDTYASLLRVFS